MEDYNLEHLYDLIKDENSVWIWCFEDGKHWISNKHLCLIVDENDMEDEVFFGMKEVFENKSPASGETLYLTYGVLSKWPNKPSLAEQVKTKVLSKKSSNKGKTTPLVFANKSWRARWIEFPEFNLFLDDRYISLLWDALNEPIYADGPHEPVFLCDGNLIIVPIKNIDKPENMSQLERFKELIFGPSIEPTEHAQAEG